MYFVVDFYMFLKTNMNLLHVYIETFVLQNVYVQCMYIYVWLFFSRYNSVDINVAVATDAGLITPIVSRADIKVGHSKEYIVL